MSKCKYCNSTNHGSGCSNSPHKHHEHNEDEKKCVYCNKPDRYQTARVRSTNMEAGPISAGGVGRPIPGVVST